MKCPFCGHRFSMHWKRCWNLMNGATDERCKCTGMENWLTGKLIPLLGWFERKIRGE